MPQKRNPDTFELVRGTSAALLGQYAGALATVNGLALSYHRDLQVTKAAVLSIVERGIAALDAFARALPHVQFNGERMTAMAGESYTVATDVADALISGGMSARAAHAQVGEAIRSSEQSGNLPHWPDARASVEGKATGGSTNPAAVRTALAALEAEIAGLQA
jgi:argininosuccinate lyase